MDNNTVRAINDVSKKVNRLIQQVDNMAVRLHQQSTDSINTSDGGIEELAAMVANLEERVAALEKKK